MHSDPDQQSKLAWSRKHDLVIISVVDNWLINFWSWNAGSKKHHWEDQINNYVIHQKLWKSRLASTSKRTTGYNIIYRALFGRRGVLWFCALAIRGSLIFSSKTALQAWCIRIFSLMYKNFGIRIVLVSVCLRRARASNGGGNPRSADTFCPHQPQKPSIDGSLSALPDSPTVDESWHRICIAFKWMNKWIKE